MRKRVDTLSSSFRDTGMAECRPFRAQLVFRGMRRRKELSTDLALDAMEAGPHVGKKEVTLANIRVQWLESTMIEVRDDAPGLETWGKRRNEVDCVVVRYSAGSTKRECTTTA